MSVSLTQHTLTSSCRGHARGIPLLAAASNRQRDVEFAAATELARHRDRPTVSDDDAMDDRETKTGSLIHRPGREERIEDALQRRLVHATPGVGYGQFDLRSVANRPQPHRDFAGLVIDGLGCIG